MNPYKRGLSSAGKAGVVVVVVILVLGGAYFLPGLTKGGGSQQSTAGGGAVSTVGGNETIGLYSLVQAFSQMQLVVAISTPDQGASNTTYSYSVIGKGTINSTQYTRVEFLTVGVGDNVVMWFNSAGRLGEVDVPGVRNYTGNGIVNLPYFTTYANLFGIIPTITNNATLFSMLSKYSETTMNIGPTQADVTTYTLPAPKEGYSSLTVEVATVPANNVTLAVYLYARMHDGSTTQVEVSSLKV